MRKPFLCNGANLCYSKSSFKAIEGFTGNDSIASGDDIFLLEKMVVRYPDGVKYLKSPEAIVQTKPENSFKDLIQQRVRWASKTGSYKNSFAKLVGIVVFTTNLLLVILLIMALFHKIPWQYFGLFFLLKFNVDFVLLYKTVTFFDQQNILKKYLLSSLFYPFFIVLVGLLSFNKSFEWKGRSFDK
jgi:poly-beta-1,6-N-acetyl-D-glucosamine synthase